MIARHPLRGRARSHGGNSRFPPWTPRPKPTLVPENGHWAAFAMSVAATKTLEELESDS